MKRHTKISEQESSHAVQKLIDNVLIRNETLRPIEPQLDRL